MAKQPLKLCEPRATVQHCSKITTYPRHGSRIVPRRARYHVAARTVVGRFRGRMLSQGLLVSRPPLKRCQYMRISVILPSAVSQKMAPRASTHSPVRFRR